MLKLLQELNPAIRIYDVHSPEFKNYGVVLESYDFDECLRVMQRKCIPESGNCYIAKDEDLMNTKLASFIRTNLYAEMPIQIGYCNGNTDRLNALEYHKCSEIDVAATDLVLLLSDVRKLNQNHLDSSSVVGFYLPEGTPVELYSTTLHFAPCKVKDSGFKSIIILTDETNQPRKEYIQPISMEDQLIWMKNKWLIAHKDSIPASKGAYIGIDGDNIHIKYK